MKITAITPQKNDPDRVDVHVDGAFRLALAAETAWGARLHVGDEVTGAQMEELERRDRLWKAREAALVLLSFRPRSAQELRRRLREKEFPEEVVEEALGGLEGTGLVDDAAFAATFVRDRVRFRPRGRRRLAAELRAKGVDAETAHEAISEVFEDAEVSETELAREAAAKWSPRAGEDRQKARQRFYAFLARRGFGGDAIREVMEERFAGGGEDDETGGA
ncbi:MAG TPA: regulatory protein RecX [Longimicrobiaceae bacterium]|nr:regulatory protein RecX [Longimicrobiaceae bacterium]